MNSQDDGSTVERLRPLVGRGGWDYCVLWKLSQDQRFLELKACCCGGTECSSVLHDAAGGIQVGPLHQGSQHGFHHTVRPCRDGRSPRHPRTAACDTLAALPTCIPLNRSSTTNTIHEQALVSGVAAWLHHSQLRSEAASSRPNEMVGTTKVLVPVPGGVAELFVQNHVPEDEDVVNFVSSRFTSPDHEAASPYATSAAADCQSLGCGPTDLPQLWVAAAHSSIPNCDHPAFPWDLHADQTHVDCPSSLNLFNGGVQDDEGILEGSADSIHCSRPLANPADSVVGLIVHQLPDVTDAATMADYSTMTRELGAGEGGHEKESVKEEGNGRVDSGLEGSDPGDDDDDKVGRSGKRLSSKNLMAERRRRKKLNDRLYALRSLVPKISKMDRASILGDAIEFVTELEKEVKKLQEQLEDPGADVSRTKLNASRDGDDNAHPEDADGWNNDNGTQQMRHRELPATRLQQSAESITLETENSGSPRRASGGSSAAKSTNGSRQQRCSPAINEDQKGTQMEPQVEVCQIGANKFHLKVFCEHRRGGFVRLMETMASLGLEVTTVNVTTSKPLVLNIFEVEKRDSELMQADQLRSSLLRLAMDSENGELPGDSNVVACLENSGTGEHRCRRRLPAANLRQHQPVTSHKHAHHLTCFRQQH